MSKFLTVSIFICLILISCKNKSENVGMDNEVKPGELSHAKVMSATQIDSIPAIPQSLPSTLPQASSSTRPATLPSIQASTLPATLPSTSLAIPETQPATW